MSEVEKKKQKKPAVTEALKVNCAKNIKEQLF